MLFLFFHSLWKKVWNLHHRSMLLTGTCGIFFRIFRLYPTPRMRFQVEKTWAWNFSVRKIAIPQVLQSRIGRKMTRLTDTNEENVSIFFFRIFRPRPCPEMRYEVAKMWFRQWPYDLISQLTESGDYSFYRAHLVEYLEFFAEFFVHPCFRRKTNSNSNTLTNEIQENFSIFLNMNRKFWEKFKTFFSIVYVERVIFRPIAFNRTLEIAIFLIERFQGRVSSTSNLILGAGYRRKAEKIPDVPLSNIDWWCKFQIFSWIRE